VLDAANRLRVAGHTVIAPDLYAGQLAATVDEGFALCDQIGWPVILGRARQALAGMPAETVLSGLSMGAAVAVWEQAMTDAGAAVQVFRYPGAGHLFTDPATPDHDGRAAALAWQRSLSFLADL
jgi:dienelactone hydrolase